MLLHPACRAIRLSDIYLLIAVNQIDDRPIRSHNVIGEWFRRGYIKEKGYKADKAVSDKLKDSLKSMEEGNIDRFIKLIDDAMEKCDKREADAEGEGEKLLQPSDVA